jgi:hypothetical protein
MSLVQQLKSNRSTFEISQPNFTVKKAGSIFIACVRIDGKTPELNRSNLRANILAAPPSGMLYSAVYNAAVWLHSSDGL